MNVGLLGKMRRRIMRAYDSYVYIGLLIGFGAVGCSAKLLVEKSEAASNSSDGGPDAAVMIGAGANGGGGQMPDPNPNGGTAGTGAGTGGAGGNAPDGDVAPFVCHEGRDPLPPRWTGNGATCPASSPQENSNCDIPGSRCAYAGEDGGHGALFHCIPTSRQRSVWMLEGPYSPSLGDGSGPDSCSSIQPIDGTSCVLSRPQDVCTYVNGVYCDCKDSSTSGGGPTWSCTIKPPSGNASFPHPDTIDETLRIADLTDHQRKTWCEWYSCLPPDHHTGQIRLTDAPVQSDGYTVGDYCSIDPRYYANGSLPGYRLSIAQCEANLSFSRCGATLFELDDCILTMMNGEPHPLGCGRYFDTEECAETIVNKNAEPPYIPDSGTYRTAPPPDSGPYPDAGAPVDCSVRVE
jgi:hypothetical protein